MEIWHLYLITTVSAICGAFQWPAYSAATTQLVPSEELGRMNGLVSVSRAAAGVLAPSGGRVAGELDWRSGCSAG